MYSDVYRPLTTSLATRVLTLLPGAPDSPLTAKLVEVDLSKKPFYDAISYTWGDDTSTTTITFDNTHVNIRHNLVNALRQLRRHGQTTPLWIDALSIDQTNLTEKGQQVAMIGDIFRGAQKILVWVGTHANDSETLFQPWLCPSRACPVVPPDQNAKLWKVFNKQVHIPSDQQLRRFSAWQAFFRRPYWRRLCIIQELVVAKSITVHCGDSRATWQDLIYSRTQPWMDSVFDGIELDRLSVSSSGDTAISVQELANFRTRLQSITQLDCLRHQRSIRGIPFIVQFRHAGNVSYDSSTLRSDAYDVAHINSLFPDSQCFDSRDSVYGLLALERNDEFKRKMQPDYHVDAADLFVKVCMARFSTWHAQWAGYLSGLDPDSKKREVIETMEGKLLVDKQSFEQAVSVLELMQAGSANKKEKRDLDLISTVLALSTKVGKWSVQVKSLTAKEREKLEKQHEEYKKTRRKIQA